MTVIFFTVDILTVDILTYVAKIVDIVTVDILTVDILTGYPLEGWESLYTTQRPDYTGSDKERQRFLYVYVLYRILPFLTNKVR